MLFGKNSLNSAYSCAERVLLCEITSTFLFNLEITFAIVKVLPLPVTPNNICFFLFDFIPSIKLLIACGWSPFGDRALESIKFFFYY